MNRPLRKILILLGLGFLAWLLLVKGVLGQEAFPWTDPLVQTVIAAATPQDAVDLVIAAFNEPGSNGLNFAEGVTTTVASETWLVVATDWEFNIPTEADPLNIIEGSGYGVSLIAGPWEGYIPSGVGVILAEEVEEVPTSFSIFLPFVTTPPSPWMSHPLVQQALATGSPAASVAFVVGVFNNPATTGEINFAGGYQLVVASGQAYLVATDLGYPAPAGAIPVNTDGGYGTWLLGPGTWTLTSGVGVPLH